MPLTRSIYADRDGLIAELATERDAARRCAALPDITRYRRHYWNGREDGLNFAIALLRDWQGEDKIVQPLQPLHCSQPENNSHSVPASHPTLEK